MSSVPTTRRKRQSNIEYRDGVLPLENGNRLTQPEFHRRYQAMPEGVKTDLIGGVVYMPSPPKRPHSRPHAILITWLGVYEEATPGVEVLDNATVIMGEGSEPQPDGALVIVGGGSTRVNPEEFMVGAPELVVEIAASSASIDLHAKRHDYEKAGVKEYIVVAVRMKKVFWWSRRGRKFVELTPGADGIMRSESFPGLWLDPEALVKLDSRRVLAVLRKGLASPEHAAFVSKLAGSRSKS